MSIHPHFDTWVDPKPTAEIVFKSDPIDVFMDVYSPEGDAKNTPSPLVLWYHLGGLFYGDRKTMLPRWLFNACRQRGWTVISADYRLCPESNVHDILSDLTDCWAFVRTQLNGDLRSRNLPTADLNSLFVAGISAGGYMALQGGHLFQPKPNAVFSISAQSDVDPAWWNAPHPGSLELGGTPIQKAFDMEKEISQFFAEGKKPVSGVPFKGDENPREMLYHYVIGKGIQFRTVFGVERVSTDPSMSYFWPQTSITADYPPTYILAGAADLSVPHGESIHIHKVMEEHGVEHTFNLIESKDHVLDQEEGSDVIQAAREDIMAFLESKC